LLKRVIDLGFDALIMDVDLVLLRNPFIYFQSQPLCDMTFYENGPAQLEGSNKWVKRDWTTGFEVNTGFMLVRSTATTQALVNEFVNSNVSEKYPGTDDQHLFNMFMADRKWNAPAVGTLVLPFKIQSTQCGQWKGLSVHILPPALFSSWQHFFVANLSDWTLQTPFVIHYNYLTGYAQKSEKMVQHGFWRV
jgi:hypothetical protein